MALGLFALAEVAFLIKTRNKPMTEGASQVGSLKVTKSEMKEISGPIARHSVIGFLLGILPGAGATIASFISYITEKRISNILKRLAREISKGSQHLRLEQCGNERRIRTPSDTRDSRIRNNGRPARRPFGRRRSAGTAHADGSSDVFWGVIASMYIAIYFC